LDNNPQKKGMVIKTRIVTPKKPNSARRPVAKITLVSKKETVAHIPGIGHNLRKHSNVLIRGGGARDLPGVSYTCIRGLYDLNSVLNKQRRRSIYGVSIPENKKKKLRRKFRQN
jgi:small subunit ribosomal protein S12